MSFAFIGSIAANRILRESLSEIEAASDRREQLPSDEGVSFLGATTTAGSYPMTCAAVYVVIPQLIDATDAEGAVPSFDDDGSGTVPAINVGNQVPPQGTLVLVHGAGGRWTFAFNG